MQVKGTSIITTRDFVKETFPSKYNDWVKSLPAESKKLYEGHVRVSDWYEIKPAYYEPMDKIVEQFFSFNPQKAGEEMGKFSAKVALTGIYKVFLFVATPQYLMKRASRMVETFYVPSEVEVVETASKMAVMKIKKFDGITKTLEYRFAGWCVKALELCNCKNISYKITSHISSGQPATNIEFRWE
ncbi:MAG: hypothetical protein EHM93_11505 [Bacteroidales bacterium]|nr:MAG: hypothetical protein EHM93_11505 [Bacteroidales bacterium]